MSEVHEWWQRGVIYQIYPRSFQDTGSDGVGDLRGIIQRLDYLQWLGVDAIWLSPIFPSPMADFGYDVSNYVDVDPLFGSLTEFDRLLSEAHRRNIRVILDFVPNHSSDEHPWFQESRSSRDNPKRDWYLWRDAAPDGGPPNNWLSSFGGSAWTWDEQTQQYYHHHFLPKQPDLNWRNPEVVAAMLDVMRFWLDRGVDGFRIDVIWLIIKDEEYRDNPRNPDFQPHEPPHHQLLATYSTDRPEVHTIISQMRQVLDSYGERMMVGEIYLPVEQLITYYGAQGSGVHLPFNFHLILTDWRAPTIAALIEQYEAALPAYGWPNWVLGNHDQPRLATRLGPEQARVAGMLLLTLRGTPTMYYGDEIGMQNVPIPPDRIQDPVEKNLPGKGLGRDPQRTPMRWNNTPLAGFSAHDPWLPIGPQPEGVSVAEQKEDPTSTLTFYRRMLALRRQEPALSVGGFSSGPTSDEVLSYVRRYKDDRFIIALNLTNRPATLETPMVVQGTIVLSTHLDRERETIDGPVELRGGEGVIIRSAS